MDVRGLDEGFEQDGFRVRAEWGESGVDMLAGNCTVLVVVDVLSFSTTVDLAVGRGARILPVGNGDDLDIAADGERARAGGAVVVARSRAEWRPSVVAGATAGTTLVVSSPNGATLCTRAAGREAVVLAGCLRNAGAVARRAVGLAGNGAIGVVPAGERWGSRSGPLRPSVEDFLGAGAIVAALRGLGMSPVSPEAELAATAFLGTAEVPRAIAECVSGRELAAHANSDDVVLAGQVGVGSAAPRLVAGVFRGD